MLANKKPTILVVDDEKSVRELIGINLAASGYEVFQAEGGRQAIEIAADPEKEIDILITDIIMPQMNGRELANRICPMKPFLKVLFMSAYSAEILSNHKLCPNGSDFIRKPFTMDSLLERTRFQAVGTQPMKIEIWSDVMCPFCYIGKRRLERALDSFPRKDEVEIVWKSFQLNPGMKTEPGKGITDYLAEKKGWSREQTLVMHARLTQSGKEMGLVYDFDRAVVANSFDAHRLVQLAKTLGLGDATEERLFRAYFTEGKNIADRAALLELGRDAGLPEEEIRKVLDGDAFAKEVRRDADEARQLGVTGVPFFVLDRKYAVSGAQDTQVFVKAL